MTTQGETAPRTVGAHDISAFAGLVGDYNRIHLDDRWQAGGRIAHGLLSASWLVGGLSQDAPATVGRRDGQVCLTRFEVNYRKPVRPGDSLRGAWRRRTADTGGSPQAARGLVFHILNHGDEAVSDGHLDVAGDFPPAPAPWPAVRFEPTPGQVYYLEDFVPGSHAGETEGRTLNDADVTAYGGFTGDNGGLHGDAPFARAGLFGAPIVQPMLVFNIGFALWLRDWCRMGTPNEGMAGHLCDRWTLHGPMFPGDTLRCRYRTLNARASRTRAGMGLVTVGLQLLNQCDAVTMSAEVVMMFPARSDAADPL